MLNLRSKWMLVMALWCALAGCKGSPSQVAPADGAAPSIVATTTMIGDMAAQLGLGVARVETIMRPGGDPHLYQPSPKDAKLVAKSALVLTNGLHLEGWIDDLVKNAGGERPVVVVSEGIKPVTMPQFPGGVDPHFWFDLEAWAVATRNVEAALLKMVSADAASVAKVKANATAYRAKLDALSVWSKACLATVPKAQRVLVTSHDAFNYFGRAFEVEVVGIQGLSTEQEASQRDVANIIELVRQRQVPAIFVETSVNPALIKQVAREAQVKVAGPLYSDSVGPLDGPAGSYVGMFSQNVLMIVSALGGQCAPFKEEGRP